jgi:hypothetical protein
MRQRILGILVLQTVLVVTFCCLVLSGRVPLGVPGEWTWLRVPNAPEVAWLPVGLAAVAAYAGFAAWGFRRLASPRQRIEAAWVGSLALAAIVVQFLILTAAPEGYGIKKWSTICYPGSSGYLLVAEHEAVSIGRFWKNYPDWIRSQDSLHIGTHPPGLIVGSRWVFQRMKSNPALLNAILDATPRELDRGIRTILGPLTKPERATITLIGLATLIACAMTVVPIYILARSCVSPSEAWVSACLWPLVPAAVLFQPTADCAFPFLSASALALASRSCRGKSLLAILSGLVLALGMQFTLAFLPVGLIVAIVLLVERGHRLRHVALVGAGFFGLTGLIWLATRADPFLIWWINSRNHARFYEQYPRTYGLWVGVNLVEVIVSVGLPAAVWMVCAWPKRRDLVPAWATLIVLLILNLSGKNLSEVARLWLPFVPMLLVAAGAGMKAAGGGAKTLAATITLTGLETLILQTTIQVVYPI